MSKTNIITTLCAAGCLCIATSVLTGFPAQGGSSDVAVKIGGDNSLDACAAVGVVSGLNPNGDNALSVRSGPGLSYKRVESIGANQRLWICDETGAWLGVVFSRDQNANCGVSSPVDAKQPYAGPCHSGWVHKDFVTLIAG